MLRARALATRLRFVALCQDGDEVATIDRRPVRPLPTRWAPLGAASP